MSSAGAHAGSGIRRRELLQVGYSGMLGLGLPGLFAGRGKNRRLWFVSGR